VAHYGQPERYSVTDNVTNFTGITYLDIPPDRILDGAKGELESVIVIGYTKDGEEYFAASVADGAEVLWMLERNKLKLLSVPDEEQFS
jgi:hypothetical protein